LLYQGHGEQDPMANLSGGGDAIEEHFSDMIEDA
jgi:hypothetical protein